VEVGPAAGVAFLRLFLRFDLSDRHFRERGRFVKRNLFRFERIEIRSTLAAAARSLVRRLLAVPFGPSKIHSCVGGESVPVRRNVRWRSRR